MTVSYAHALTAGELALLRSRQPAQRADLFLAVWPVLADATVFTARVNEPIGITDDQLIEIDYDGGNGAANFANCLPDMTVWVGTSAGAYDAGIARLRGFSATSGGVTGTMYLGEMSEIAWADNMYLTVLDDFTLWPRHIYLDDAGNVFIDRGYYDEGVARLINAAPNWATAWRDGSYTDQHRYPDPVPVLQPDAAMWLPAGGGSARIYHDASSSFTLDGGAVTYAWRFNGASANGGTAAATTWSEYDTAGVYRVDCEVTRAYAGATQRYTGFRRVFVFDDVNMPVTKFELEECSGSYDRGGWAFSVRMWDEATRSEIADRSRVILFARDWYDGAEQSIGPLRTDAFGGQYLRANIVATGWIAGESIIYDNERGYVTFDVEGPQYWLDQMEGFPSGVRDYDGVPPDWTEFDDLTVDKGLWHFLHWRTTATRCMDLMLSDDTRQVAVFDAPPGSLWQQMDRVARETILAHPCCNRYGQLFIQIDANLLPVGDRGGIPTVHDIEAQDWRTEIEIRRVVVPDVGLINLSGVAYHDGDAEALWSLAPGHIPRHYGSTKRQDRLALTDQAQSNVLAGLILGQEINTYPSIVVRMAANHRMFDVCPHQYGETTISVGDTERGIALTDFEMIPRRISFDHDTAVGALLTEVTFEGVTTETGSENGDPPPEPPDPGPMPPPPPPPPPPEIPTTYVVVLLSESQLVVTTDFLGATPSWTDISSTLTGTFHNVVIDSAGAGYCTTTDGLWYCDSIIAPIWNLVLEPSDAEIALAAANPPSIPSDFTARFGALNINSSGTVCVAVHIEAGAGASTRGILYYGSGSSWTSLTLPVWTDIGPPQVDRPLSIPGVAGQNHCIGRHNEEFLICCGQPAGFAPTVVRTTDFAGWIIYPFYVGTQGMFVNCCERGFTASSPEIAGDIWQDYNRYNLIAGTDIFHQFGMSAIEGSYLYIDTSANNDLYLSNALLAEADVVFDTLSDGGRAVFFPNDPTQIAWVTRTSTGSGNIIVYTDDGGASWVGKNGNLFAVLGGNWAGETAPSRGNAVVYVAEI